MYLGSLSKVLYVYLGSFEAQDLSLKRDILWRILGGWDAFNLFCHPEYTFSHSNSPPVPRGGRVGGGGKFIQSQRSERGGPRARPRYPGESVDHRTTTRRETGAGNCKEQMLGVARHQSGQVNGLSLPLSLLSLLGIDALVDLESVNSKPSVRKCESQRV